MSFDELRLICEKLDIPLISHETQDTLSAFIEQYKPKRILEVGSAIGYSSVFFATQISSWNGIVYTFEISYPSYIQCMHTIKEFDCHNILSYFLDFSSVSLSKIITQKVDMIFIDAQKSEYLNYLLKIREVIADNGIIILDDIIKYQNKTLSLYEYLEKNQINYEIISSEDGDGLMIIHAKELLLSF